MERVIAGYKKIAEDANAIYSELSDLFNAYVDVEETRFEECKRRVFLMHEQIRKGDKFYFRCPLLDKIKIGGFSHRAWLAVIDAENIIKSIEEENAIKRVA